MIANGVVLSHLTYLIQLYGGCSEQLISSLQILQNKSARLVTNLDGSTPIATLLLQCGWMSVRQMIAYHSILLLHTSKQNKKSGYIYSKISTKFERRTRLGTTGGIKDMRNFGSTLAQASFLPRSIKIWNEQLPASIRSEESLDEFKEKLKTWITKDIKI